METAGHFSTFLIQQVVSDLGVHLPDTHARGEQAKLRWMRRYFAKTVWKHRDAGWKETGLRAWLSRLFHSDMT